MRPYRGGAQGRILYPPVAVPAAEHFPYSPWPFAMRDTFPEKGYRGWLPGGAEPRPYIDTIRKADYNVPFVDNTPLIRASLRVAASRALAKALNMASSLWWSFSPYSTFRCRFIMAL